MRANIILHVIVVGVLVHLSRDAMAQTIHDVNNLKAMLMRNYSKDTLPINDQMHSKFIVNIGVLLKDLGGLDEVNEKMSTVLGFVMEWTDQNMMWNISDHNGVTDIIMDENDMWIPLLSVLNPHHAKSQYVHEKEGVTVNYYNNGRATWIQMVPISTTCDIDTTQFPFDKQNCHIHMFISGNSGYHIVTKPIFADGHLLLYTGNGAWDIVNHSVEGGTRSDFVVTYFFQRKPLYMLINVLLPIIMLTLLTPLVFLLPNDTGERVMFSITTLLAISVYMIIIGDNLPKNSKPMPFISIMLFIWYAMNSSNVLVVIYNLTLYNYSGDKPVPRAACMFVRFIKYIRCSRPTRRLPDTGCEIRGRCFTTEDGDSAERPEISSDSVVTWRKLSYAVDFFCLVTYFSLKVVFIVIFLIYTTA